MKLGTILLIVAGTGAVLATLFQMRWTSTAKPKPVGEFIPTNEWQEVLPGQAVPKVNEE